MFDLARSHRKDGLVAYSRFQEEEFKFGEKDGYMAATHQKFVGAGCFDRAMNAVTGDHAFIRVRRLP